eukprot:333300-Prymnesium_polylepis.1
MYLSFRARAKPVGGSSFHVNSRVLCRGTYVTPVRTSPIGSGRRRYKRAPCPRTKCALHVRRPIPRPAVRRPTPRRLMRCRAPRPSAPPP